MKGREKKKRRGKKKRDERIEEEKILLYLGLVNCILFHVIEILLL